MPCFRAGLGVEDKGKSLGFDPVTEADRSAEQAITRLIQERFPDHGVLGEEFGEIEARSPYRWLIDPIDGTRAFIMGLPLWGTLIGLTVSGKPWLGMMDQPFTGERFWGDGKTAHYCMGERASALSTRPCARLEDAILTATTPDMFAEDEAIAFERLAGKVRMRRYGGDCYAYCLLAMGFIDVVVEASLKPFDIVPLIPIIEGAGGIVTGWDGGAAETSSRVVACGDRRLHGQALAFLNDQSAVRSI